MQSPFPLVYTKTMDILPSHGIDWHGNFGLTEASSLGLAPGYWPKQIQVKSSRTGEVRTFDLASVDGVDESMIVVGTYLSGSVRIDVIND